MDQTPDSKGKYQPWSHEEFMSDRRVRRMSSVALKTYMMLLHEAFVCSTRPHLPDDEEELELMAYCSDHEEWMSVRDTVLGMFSKGMANGKPVLFNKRLNQDWDRLLEIREKRRIAGELGAEARWGPREMAKMAKNDKEVKEDKLSEESNESEVQENILKIKDEMKRICIEHGVSDFAWDDSWKEATAIAKVHSAGAVAVDFDKWLSENEGDTWLRGPVKAYLGVAIFRLGSKTTTVAVALRKDEVTDLVFKLTKMSDNQIAFLDKQKVRLAETLKKFTAEEVEGAFREWLDNQDLSDVKNLSYLPGKFVQIVDSLANATREQRKERADAKLIRDAAAKRLSEEAEADRAEREKRRLEEEANNPLADLFEL